MFNNNLCIKKIIFLPLNVCICYQHISPFFAMKYISMEYIIILYSEYISNTYIFFIPLRHQQKHIYHVNKQVYYENYK